MAQVYSTATLGLRVNAQQFNKEIADAGITTQATLDKMKLSADAFGAKWADLTSGIKDTKRIISGILVSQGFYALMGGMSGAVAEAVKFSMNMETAAISMEYFVDGANKAAKAAAFLREINTFAAETPFNTEEAISMSKYMQAVGISMNTTKSVLGVITDAAAATGATDENLQRIVFALGQMQTKGRIANEEIRQLANANIPIYDILQEELNLTGAQISNIGKYWVSADKAIVAILNGLEKRYDGAAERVSNTVSGMLDTLSDNSKIITQEAFGGIYDAASNALTKVRDLSDKYREVATTEGSMGLFNQVLTDIDPTGEIGGFALAAIGNVRQLGGALKDLYISAQPLIGVFGQGVYAAFNVATITMTGMTQAARTLVDGMNKLGITTGSVAKVMSSLYVTYKAATWMGTLGQAAVSATYSLFQTATSIRSILPASLQANAGVTMLTASLAGLISYGLAAYGVFRMLNNMSAGLSTDAAGGMPSDYGSAMDAYQQKMDAYNEAIAKYQESFNQPYTAITDGSETAVKGLSDVAKASKKAAGSVKNDWTAAFDEVYTIPEDKAGGGGGGDDFTLPDLGSLLTLPSITFPNIDDLMPEMPEFDWGNVFEGSPLDTDVLKADWWKILLPGLLTGMAVKLGNIMAKNNATNMANNKAIGEKITSAVLSDKAANIAARKALTQTFVDTKIEISKILTKLGDPTLGTEARKLLERNLEEATRVGAIQADRLGKVEDALLLIGNDRSSRSTLDTGIQYVAVNKILATLDDIEQTQKKLADAAFATTEAGYEMSKTLDKLQNSAARSYSRYLQKYGNDDAIEQLLRGASVKVLSIDSALDKVNTGIKELIGLAGHRYTDPATKVLVKDIKDAINILSTSPFVDQNFMADVTKELSVIEAAIRSESDIGKTTESLQSLMFFEKNYDALKSIGVNVSEFSGLLSESIEHQRKVLNKLTSENELNKARISALDKEWVESVKLQQQLLENNKAFKDVVTGPIARQLGGIMGELAAIENATVSSLKKFTAGSNELLNIGRHVDNLLGHLPGELQIFKPIIEGIKDEVSTLTTSNANLDLNLRAIADLIDTGLETVADGLSATTVAIDDVRKTFDEAAKAANNTVNRAIREGMEKLATASNAKPVRNVGDTPSDVYFEKAFDSFNKALYDKSGIRSIEDVLGDIYDEIAAATKELAKAENWSEAGLSGSSFYTSKKANEKITEAVEMLEEFYKDNYGTKATAVTSGMTAKDLENIANTIGAEVHDVPAAMADVFGKAIRTNATSKIEEVLANNKEIAQKLSVIAEAGIFRREAQLTGGDAGPAIKGISSFGQTAVGTLRGDITSSWLPYFREATDTITNLIPRTVGIEAEYGFRRIVAQYLKEIGENTYATSTYFSDDMKLQAQLDAAAGKSAARAVPMDLKLLDTSKLNEMIRATAEYSTQAGKIVKLTAQGVRQLSEVARDYVLQATLQAMIMGKGTTRLAVGDRSGTIDPFVKTKELDKLDITAQNGMGKFVQVVREGVGAAFKDSKAMQKLSDSLTIFEWSPLKEDKALLNDLANTFIDLKYEMSKRYLEGTLSKDDIIELLQPRLTTGQALPDSYYRFIGKNYDFDSRGVPSEIVEVITEQTRQLKSGDMLASSIARQRLLNVADAIYDAVQKAPKAIKDAGDEIKAVFPAFNANGTYKEVTATADRLLTSVNRINEYIDVFKGYDLSAITQFNDKLGQIYKLSKLGASSNTIINPKALPENQTTLKQLMNQTGAMAKNLERIYGVVDKRISSSLFQMASQGALGELNNPFKVMNILELREFIDTAETGFKESRLAIENMAADIVREEVNVARAVREAQTATAQSADKVIAKVLEGKTKEAEVEAARLQQLAAVKLGTSADRFEEAAIKTAEAADETAAAAKALKAATKVYDSVLNTDELLKNFKSVQFNPEALYTIFRKEGIGDIISNITVSGSKLQQMQEAGRTGFVTSTIRDQSGKLVYAPIEQAVDDIPNFFSLLDEVLGGIKDSSSLLNGADILKATSEAVDGIFGDAIGEALEEAFANADLINADDITEAYSKLGKMLIDNLQEQGVKLGSKAQKSIAKYFDALLGSDGGLGIPISDIQHYITEATKEIGWRAVKNNTEAIKQAVTVTADDLASQIAEATVKAPLLELSDDVLATADAILSKTADDLAINTAKRAANGLSASKLMFGGALGVGALDIAGVALEGYFANKEQKQQNATVAESLKELAKTDDTLAGALDILQQNNVDIADILSDGKSNWFTSMFGKSDLSNAAYQSVGAEAGAVAAGGVAGGMGYLAGLGSGPVGWIAAAVATLGSLGYNLGGGNTTLSKYGDAYYDAVENDTFYKNALEQGMSEEEARAMSDAIKSLERSIILSGDTDKLFTKDDAEKYLYGTTDGFSQATAKLMGDSFEAAANRMLRLQQALGEKETFKGDYDSVSVWDTNSLWTQTSEYATANGMQAGDIYQTGDVGRLKEVLDYIFKDGHYDTDIAKDFFENYGEEAIKYLGTTEEYGKYVDVFNNIEEFVGLLNDLGAINESYADLVSSGKLSMIVEAANGFIDQYHASVENKLSVMNDAAADGKFATVERVATWNTSDDNKDDDRAASALQETFAGFDKELAARLAEELGITVDTTVKSLIGASGDTLKELYAATSVDLSKMKDDIVGWTLNVPDEISLDSASLSANDIEVLATAGIQINGDGTVTFMKALNENITGTDRDANFTAADISQSLIDILSAKGVGVTTGDVTSNVKLDTASLSQQMSGAMFQTSLDAANELSAYQKEVLSGLGTVLDSGFIEITNSAVLSGRMTIEQYLGSLGTSINDLSPEIKNELLRIDEVIAQGGQATAESVATWADGIVMESPIDADMLTTEMRAAFAQIGVTFTEEGDKFMMVVNRLGDQLKNGETLIPTEMWDSVSESVKMNLEKLGVTWEETAGYVKVDISNTLGSLVSLEDVNPQIISAFDALGITFETEAGMIVGMTDRWGQAIEGNLIKVPQYMESTFTPEIKAAFQSMGLTITQTEEGMVIDMTNIMSNGIGNLVSLFTEQPEFWNQIPDAIKQTLIQAGVVTADGLLQINAKTLTGLQKIGNDWVGFWENMPDDTKKAFDEAGIATKDGCFMVSKYIDESSIPENVDYIIKKFDELPPSMKEAVLASGEAINANGYVVYNATASMVANMENAILENKAGAVSAAQTMAQEIANAIAGALAGMKQLEAATAAVNSGPFKNGKSVGSFKKLYGVNGDYSYAEVYNSKGQKEGYYVYNNTTHQGKEVKDLTTFSPFASGGTTTGNNLPVLAGEYGTEMAILPDGSIRMLGADGKGTLADLPEGTRILNAADTQEILKYTGPIDSIKKYASGNTTLEAGSSGQYSLSVADADDYQTVVTKQLAQIVQYLAPATTEDATGTETFAWLAENLNQGLRGVVAAISEFLVNNGNATTNFLSSLKTDIIAAITANSGKLESALDSLGNTLSSAISSISTYSDYSKSQFKATETQGKSLDEIAKTIAEAKAEWAAATTDEERAAAHAKAEAARGEVGYSGGDYGSQNVGGDQKVVDSINALVEAINSTGSGNTATITDAAWLKPITGSASGSLVTKDALYRAGELGLNEAIIPLERASIMNKVGSTIASYIPTESMEGAINVALTTDNLMALAKAIYGPLLTENPAFTENFNQAIRGAVAALSELSVKSGQDSESAIKSGSSSVVEKLSSVDTDIVNAVKSAGEGIISAVGSISLGNDKLTETLKNNSSAGMTTADIIAQAKAEYAAATTDAERAAAHAKAESARGDLGYSGGIDGSQYIPLDSIKGSASGSLVNKDSLYRAGEFGLNEAIIPLERPNVMSKVGQAIASFMPTGHDGEIQYARTLQNAGVSAPVAQDPYAAQTQMAGMVDGITQRVLEAVLPAMSYGSDDSEKTPIYVGTLVADDNGLKQLERKLYVIRQAEQSRRS